MRAPSALELLEIWERGAAQDPAQRALELLAAAFPEASAECLASLAVGQRDARLLMLREALFGSEMAALVLCPHCGGHLELSLDAAEMRLTARREPEAEISLDANGYQVRFRLPTSEDLVLAAEQRDAGAGRDLILGRCVLEAHCNHATVTCDQLPPEVVAAVAERMVQADPMAAVQPIVSCPLCEHQWRAAFDIVSFLWGEIEVWAARVLSEVHTLASAYGWCEREILALSPMRRQFYLEAIGA